MSYYSKSFRIRVAQEATDPKMQGMEEHIAKKYGVRVKTVLRWAEIYREYGKAGLGRGITNPITKKSDREIQLEKENAELKEEVAILKKAAAFLAEVGRR